MSSAYIASLPDTPAPATIKGDVDKGRAALRDVRRLPRRRRAAGSRPPTRRRLKGMSDWYMARQLKNFRTASAAPIRRTSYGAQMALIGRDAVSDDAAIGDSHWPTSTAR